MSIKNHEPTPPCNSSQSCPPGKYWIKPHQRKKTTKSGKTYVEQVKGYCTSYHSNYHKLAQNEKMSLDNLYFALTIYGEARSESDTSRRAIAWIIQNRFIKEKWGKSYQKVVLSKTQISCWRKSDNNYEKLQHPGKDGTYPDELAWEKCKIIAQEIQNAPKETNPLPDIYHYFSGKPTKRWQKKYFDLPDVPRFHFVKLKV